MNELLNRVQQGTALPEDYRALRELIDADTTGEVIAFVHEFHSRQAAVQPYDKENWGEVVHNILQVDKQERGERAAAKIRFLLWKKMAAAALIIMMLGAAGYWWLVRDRQTEVAATGNKRPVNDIAPGGNKAILTLADNSTIILDSAANGKLIEQGKTSVIKSGDGQLVYDARSLTIDHSPLTNTLATPRGGQYQLVLPDGTKVWLNAASSITYPTAFVGKERKVKINGEAYFEVSKNKEKPFIVDIDGKSTVEVLGTSFNINSYNNEENIKTTLLEGSVKVSVAGRAKLLKPGQQAMTGRQYNSQVIVVSSNVDPDQAMAWKNGLFNFNGMNVHEVMRQLERWYDIKVQFEGKAPDLTIKGKMFRNVNLSDVLEMFQKMELKFRMEGKTLVVLEK